MRKIIIPAILCILILDVAATQLDIFSIKRVERTMIVKDSVTADALIASKYADAAAVYDDEEKTLRFFVNETESATFSWRLIHDGKRVIDLMYTKGVTSSIYKIFEADSAQKCLDEIAQLKLIDEREYKEEERVDIKEDAKKEVFK